MSYVKSNLLPGETIVYRAHLHWVMFVWPLVLSTVLIGIPWLLYEIVRRWTTEFVVTNQRVVVKRGLILRKTEELLLRKVESLQVDQGVWGRLLGYGSVRVQGTGEGTTTYRAVADPLELRRRVYMQIEAASQAV